MLLTVAQAVLATAGLPPQLVHLRGYGSFYGTTTNTTLSGYPLPQAVDSWLGIDYAIQPTGDRRFAPAEWPEPFEGVKPAVKYGNICVQDPTASPVAEQSEACLNFNVFRTPGVPLSKKLPVLVWIHGGSFCYGSYRSFDAAAFAANSENGIVVVNFHYRVNSLGFLPSRLFDEEELSNLGIRDQRLLLEFVHKHITSFGGDPNNVTLGGRSAGGHSVGIHHFHNYAGDDHAKPLFARSIHQSGSVTARAFPNATYPLYQKQYAEFVEFLGCNTAKNNAEELACLRAVDIDAIRNITTKIYRDYDPRITWPFQPVQGGTLFEKFGSQSGIDGTFFKVPTISSSTTMEGKFYVPGNLETNNDFLNFIHNISPDLTDDDISTLDKLYPDPIEYPDSSYSNAPNSTQYNRVAAAWSDYAYICPSQETSYRLSTAEVPTWKLRFNTNNSYPEWQSIPHSADSRYTWNEPTVQFPEIGHVYHGYLSSFVTTGNPNTNRYAGSPEWPNYEPEGYGLDSKPAKQLVVQPSEVSGGTQVEDDNIRREQCLYWRSTERALRLNK